MNRGDIELNHQNFVWTIGVGCMIVCVITYILLKLDWIYIEEMRYKLTIFMKIYILITSYIF